MRILRTKTNIFDLPKNNEAVCVTTNGITKKNGFAVMGKGIALEADQRYGLAGRLGDLLKSKGNHVHYMGLYTAGNENLGNVRQNHIFTFPTKHHWRDPSNPELIRQSAWELVFECQKLGIKTCYLPPAGCGCGGLNFEKQVRPILDPILDKDTTGIDFITVLRES